MTETKYLESAKAQFSQYKNLGEKTIAQISDEKINWQYNAESNSIATIVKHLSGNMFSRFTDFLTSDGEKPWRNRDQEFVSEILDRQTLLSKWNEGWNCLFQVLNSLTENDLSKIVVIRKEEHTVMEAINRQLTHYAYHVGQIVFIGKMVADDQWKSLSIPRNQSAIFNVKKGM